MAGNRAEASDTKEFLRPVPHLSRKLAFQWMEICRASSLLKPFHCREMRRANGNSVEPSPKCFLAESSDNAISAQYFRPNLQPIYHIGPEFPLESTLLNSSTRSRQDLNLVDSRRLFFTERRPSLSPTELYRFRPRNEMIYRSILLIFSRAQIEEPLDLLSEAEKPVLQRSSAVI